MKKITVSLLVLLVACSCVFAFDGMANRLSGSSKVSEEKPVVAEVPSVEEVENSSSVELGKTSSPVSAALNDLNEKKTLNKKDLELHRANLEAVAADVEMLIADAEAVHPFANAGLKLGFEDGYPVWGAVIGGGAKFGTTGIMTSLNVSYDFLKLEHGFKWGNGQFLKNFGATLMVGYEF